jgi:ABC-type cobalt transport system substrate-binding protein
MSGPETVMSIVGAMSFFILLYAFGRFAGADEVRREAVEKGHAHYDPMTRAFTWGSP